MGSSVAAGHCVLDGGGGALGRVRHLTGSLHDRCVRGLHFTRQWDVQVCSSIWIPIYLLNGVGGAVLLQLRGVRRQLRRRRPWRQWWRRRRPWRTARRAPPGTAHTHIHMDHGHKDCFGRQQANAHLSLGLRLAGLEGLLNVRHRRWSACSSFQNYYYFSEGRCWINQAL